MKKFVVANWKANKNIKETREFLVEFNNQILPENVVVIFCPSLPLLKAFEGVPYFLGAQDVSAFPTGPHTGEVAASQVAEMVDYALIGHSERRTEFKESDEVIVAKIGQAFACNIMPIVCVSNLNQVQILADAGFKADDLLLAYEPLDAISTGKVGKAEDVKEVLAFIKEVQTILPDVPVLYGGSVNSKNAAVYAKSSEIWGVLVGNASREPEELFKIIQAYA
ncbi:MAG: triose-phosphate isomerase [candidate division WWE3 bacterium]|nr:triose-phosphate isomerase [candidate division WWE3 bacterium]